MTPPPTDVEFTVLWEELGPNARRILFSIAERLVKGARQYGDFKPRRWTREALEEVLDLTVYLTAEMLFASVGRQRLKKMTKTKAAVHTLAKSVKSKAAAKLVRPAPHSANVNRRPRHG